jgi:hypothetical protein
MILTAATAQTKTKKMTAQAKIAALESQVDSLIKSKWSMEDIHSCIVKRMHDEIIRLKATKDSSPHEESVG